MHLQRIQPFKLERFFAKYEFDVDYLLSSSDCEPLTLAELLSYASEEQRSLWDNLWLGYTETKGHPLLLETIAGLYSHILPQNVLEVVPEEGIFIAMNSLLEAGDHVVVCYPAYQSLYAIADAIGCTVSHWRPNPTTWEFDVDQLAELVQENTRLIIINFPHNPTGSILTQTQFEQVVNIAREANCILFSDEMYRWSEYDAKDRLPAACEVYPQAVTLCGMSKTFALPGLRTGWLATQDEAIMRKFIHLKDYTSIYGSAPSEILALIALNARAKLVERTLTIVKDNLSVLERFFAQYSNVLRWQRPRAGLVTLVELLHDTPIDQFAAELVDAQRVMIVPASQFEMEGNTFRLGLARRNLPEALEHFEAFLQQLAT